MAIISPPGTFAGPCEGPCDDLCCEHDRWLAGQSCLLCWDPIGYGQPFDVNMTQREDGTPLVLLAHHVCLTRLRELLITDHTVVLL